MASGTPAIVTNLGGPKFFVTNGENGFVAGNIDEFVKYSIELIDNPAELARMRAASLEFAAPGHGILFSKLSMTLTKQRKNISIGCEHSVPEENAGAFSDASVITTKWERRIVNEQQRWRYFSKLFPRFGSLLVPA